MRLLFFFFLLFSSFGFSQMEFSTLHHDFGQLESYADRYIDIVVTNKGQKEGYILSVRKPSEVVYIQSRALVQKDSSLILRFQVNPRQKGKFNYTVDIFTSDKNESHQIKLSGNLLQLASQNTTSLTACPDFNTIPSRQNQKSFDLTVITIDKETRQPLIQTEVRLIQEGFQVWKLNSDKLGKIIQKNTPGMIYLFAQHPGYLPEEKGAFITPERGQVVVEMRKDPSYRPHTEDTPQLIATTETIEKPTKVKNDPLQEIELVVAPSVEEQSTSWNINWPKKKQKEETQLLTEPIVSHTPIDFDTLPKSNFDKAYFKPINVTFVLDISSSMAQNNRMDLMKFALNELGDMIRETDKISLVTYATDARVLLAPTNGMNKEALHEQVKKLKASGMTAGGAGIKLGFEQVNKSYISNGVNHVFVLTDGGFNRQTEDIQKIIKKYRSKGIQLSVVGIVNQPRDEENMRSVAKMANGEYIPIFKLEDASNNIPQLLRKLAFIP